MTYMDLPWWNFPLWIFVASMNSVLTVFLLYRHNKRKPHTYQCKQWELAGPAFASVWIIHGPTYLLTVGDIRWLVVTGIVGQIVNYFVLVASTSQ